MHDIEIETTVSANDDLLPSNTPDIVTIAADLAATFTFASHQNSIPIIRSIRVNNPTADSLEHLQLEFRSCPPFLRARTWIIDRIIAGESVTLSDRRIDLDRLSRRVE